MFLYCLTALLMSVLTVHGATFNTPYTTTSSYASYSYPSATSSCTLNFSVNRTTTDPLTFTVSKFTTSVYANRLSDSTSSLFGAYGLSINSNISTTQWTMSFVCPNGLQNVVPTNMKIYSLLGGDYYFTDTQVVPDTPTSIGYSVSIKSKADYTIGFGGHVDSGNANIGPYKAFYGPYQFNYALQFNFMAQPIETMSIILPNVIPSFSPYGYVVETYSTNSPSTGYTSLYSFKTATYGAPSNPSTYGATLQYTFPSNYNSFKDLNGNSIQIIKSTLACFCSNDGSYYVKTPSTTYPTSVLCNNVGTNCKYLSIAAKTIAAASSSGGSVSPADSAIEMSDRNYVYTSTIYSKVYYKITVPAGKTLTLKSISLYSSSSGSAYVKLYSDGYSGSYIGDYVYSSSQDNTLSQNNYYSYSKTYYVSVEPYSSGGSTKVEFYPSISSTSYSSWGYRLPVIIVCSIIFPSFLLIAVIVVITTIKKNSKRNQIV